jgi:hypothetical protein
MKIGRPPDEIETAFAMVSCAPLEAAHVRKADIKDGAENRRGT